MTPFKNKKLLILGANTTECFIVRRAQELGIYTIVTDNNQDRMRSPAKDIADEAWNISWSDIDALEEKCREESIDGVIAGFSEFRVENQIKLCERLGLPCCITWNQLEITRDKLKFKEACRENGLPTVPEFETGTLTEPPFPVIVKPVDRAGSIGISVAYDSQSYKQAIEKAFTASPSKNIIVEKYMEGLTKFDLYYVITEGHLSLVGTNDTLMYQPEKGREILQCAWLFPSRHQEAFVRIYGKNIENFIKNLDIRNGYITFSAFVDESDNFYIFESGFRLSGELSFKFGEHAFGYNYLDVLFSYAFNLEPIIQDYTIVKNLNKLLVLNHYCWDGEVADPHDLNSKTDQYETYDYLNGQWKLRNAQGTGVNKIAVSFIPLKPNENIKGILKEIQINLALHNDKGESLCYQQIEQYTLDNFLQ